MEFTKNYSDDLLMGHNIDTSNQGELQSSNINDELADYELPPYSGSSSGSEPKQQSPVKERKKSSTATEKTSTPPTAAQPSSSQQTNVAPPDMTAIKNLLMSSYSKVSHVFQWKKPIETGVYFAIGLSIITALSFFSIISVFAYSTLGIILASSLLRTYKAVIKALNKSSETPFDEVWNQVLSINVMLSPNKIHELLDASLNNLNASSLYFKQVLLVEDKIATLKFGLFIYLLTYIGAWFNGMTLITLGYFALFSVPVIYEKNKTNIDQYINLVNGQFASSVSLVTNKVTSLVFGSPPSSVSGSKSKKQN